MVVKSHVCPRCKSEIQCETQKPTGQTFQDDEVRSKLRDIRGDFSELFSDFEEKFLETVLDRWQGALSPKQLACAVSIVKKYENEEKPPAPAQTEGKDDVNNPF